MEIKPYQKMINSMIENRYRLISHFLDRLNYNLQNKDIIPTQQELKRDSVDYYKILEVTKNATQSEIRAAYLRLVKIWHPDKNPDPTARMRFEEIEKAYKILYFNPIPHESSSSIMLESPSPHALQYHLTYNNAVTFLNQTLTEQIPQDKRIILDGFAFDVDELREYAENDLYQFFKNPHLIERSQGQEFSPYAKYKLKNHPLLKVYATNLKERLSSQAKNIRPQTVDAVIKMLERFEEKGVDGSAAARADFLEHKFSLSAEEQKQLDSFIIEIPTLYGTKERFSFEKAFLGGDLVNQCIIAAKIYLWQFVVTLRPSAMNLVPSSVIEAAHSRYFRIGPLTDANHDSQRERETKTQASSLDQDVFVHFRSTRAEEITMLDAIMMSSPNFAFAQGSFLLGSFLDDITDFTSQLTHDEDTVMPEIKAAQPPQDSKATFPDFARVSVFGSVRSQNLQINNRTARVPLSGEQKATSIGSNSSPQPSEVVQPLPAVSQNNHAQNIEASPLTMNRASTLFRQMAEIVANEFAAHPFIPIARGGFRAGP